MFHLKTISIILGAFVLTTSAGAITTACKQNRTSQEQSVRQNSKFLAKDSNKIENEYLFTSFQKTLFLGTAYGLYQSVDGKHFQINKSFPDNTDVKQVKKINNTLYVLTSNGLYQSTDRTNFVLNKTIPNESDINKILKNKKGIYVETNNGLYQSTDGIKFTLNKTIPKNLVINQVKIMQDIVYVATTKGLYEARRESNLLCKTFFI